MNTLTKDPIQEVTFFSNDADTDSLIKRSDFYAFPNTLLINTDGFSSPKSVAIAFAQDDSLLVAEPEHHKRIFSIPVVVLFTANAGLLAQMVDEIESHPDAPRLQGNPRSVITPAYEQEDLYTERSLLRNMPSANMAPLLECLKKENTAFDIFDLPEVNYLRSNGNIEKFESKYDALVFEAQFVTNVFRTGTPIPGSREESYSWRLESDLKRDGKVIERRSVRFEDPSLVGVARIYV